MTKAQHRKLVRDILTALKQEIIDAIDTNKIPEYWQGTELRQLIADKAIAHAHVQMDAQRHQQYKNDVLNFNI